MHINNDKNTAITALTGFISKTVSSKYENNLFSFFFGSFAKGTNIQKSDLDLIVINDRPVEPFQEKFLSEGILFDVFVFDAESLNGALHDSVKSGNFALVNALLESTVLPNSNAISEKLISSAKKIKSIGFLRSQTSIIKQRQYITSLIDGLLSPSLNEEKNMLVVNLYKSVVETFLIAGGAGLAQNKHAIRALKLINENLLKRLNSSFQSAISGEVTPLIEIANEALDQIGGSLRDGYKIYLRPPSRISLSD